MKKIVILISGNGSNLQAILQAHQSKGWPAQIVGVISNRPKALGIGIAQAFQIPVKVLDHTQFADRADFDQALFESVQALEPDLIILAGFMRILANDFVRFYAGRLINIHPSLLPSFPGLHTHTKALATGVKWHGATVHFVTQEMDVGPIIVQGIVPVHPDDTSITLAKRVAQIEHQIYPQAVEWFILKRLHFEDGKVRVDSEQSVHLNLPVKTQNE